MKIKQVCDYYRVGTVELSKEELQELLRADKYLVTSRAIYRVLNDYEYERVFGAVCQGGWVSPGRFLTYNRGDLEDIVLKANK